MVPDKSPELRAFLVAKGVTAQVTKRPFGSLRVSARKAVSTEELSFNLELHIKGYCYIL